MRSSGRNVANAVEDSEKCVVDTNVGVIANGAADVLPECELACVRALREIMSGKRITLDVGGLIFREYLHYMSLAGKPGVGDVFMRWVHDVRFDQKRCSLVGLNHPEHDDTLFDEYPSVPDLADLDPNDRKFVAVANADPDRPAIVVGRDRGWDRHAEHLRGAGFTLVFLCGGPDRS